GPLSRWPRIAHQIHSPFTGHRGVFLGNANPAALSPARQPHLTVVAREETGALLSPQHNRGRFAGRRATVSPQWPRVPNCLTGAMYVQGGTEKFSALMSQTSNPVRARVLCGPAARLSSAAQSR